MASASESIAIESENLEAVWDDIERNSGLIRERSGRLEKRVCPHVTGERGRVNTFGGSESVARFFAVKRLKACAGRNLSRGDCVRGTGRADK